MDDENHDDDVLDNEAEYHSEMDCRSVFVAVILAMVIVDLFLLCLFRGR